MESDEQRIPTSREEMLKQQNNAPQMVWNEAILILQYCVNRQKYRRFSWIPTVKLVSDERYAVYAVPEGYCDDSDRPMVWISSNENWDDLTNTDPEDLEF